MLKAKVIINDDAVAVEATGDSIDLLLRDVGSFLDQIIYPTKEDKIVIEVTTTNNKTLDNSEQLLGLTQQYLNGKIESRTR
jgi:hypothetical protein